MANETEIIRPKIEKHFTILPNKVLQDPRLSLSAKGLYGYIMALPSNWKIFRKTLSNGSKDGTKGMTDGYKSMNRAFMELVKCGYISMTDNFDTETNLRRGYKYIVNPVPKDDDFEDSDDPFLSIR